MPEIKTLFANNRAWARQVEEDQPGFFKKLSAQQAPEYLWIGCSDSRVPANEIVGMLPGELFVHRNVANLVLHSDMNCLSVLQYAIDILKVKHIIVCGHYGCGGINAAMNKQRVGFVDNWLRNIKDVYALHRDEIEIIADESARLNRLCELNVVEQVRNLCHTSFVQDAWERQQSLTVHGWVYSLEDGHLKDLKVSHSNPEQIDNIYTLSSLADAAES
ncbi:carbonate dehydratase [Alkalimonas collagenimarina]|uniref:Carbonic anhydrase n=1 Tax=Alkalimonas collagenimarina TaxID=400390 RepID=A0ABT9H344_9GAMM|nr:carbonate dehydratase [Alkalimonas collagenimarina]MDP4537724.1 carbonate dehydratase [Alkalimonas collagenimarina]